MHPSYFLVMNEAEKSQELALSGEASEWLGSVGFWDRFNEAHGTFFGQYEEELLPGHLTKIMADSLRMQMEKLRRTELVRFRYGWDDKMEELYCSVAASVLKKELGRLADLMDEAAHSGADVYCQL